MYSMFETYCITYVHMYTVPVTCRSYGSLVYSTPSMIIEQFNIPLSVTPISVMLIVSSTSISAKHPVEHPQMKSLSLNVSVVFTSQVKVMLDPIRCSKVLLLSSTRLPGGSLTMVTETSTSEICCIVSLNYFYI